MKSIPILRRPAVRLMALGASLAAVLAVAASPAAAAAPIPAGGVVVEHASLQWSGNKLMQAENFGHPNFFSAGLSDGTEATYNGSAGDVSVLLEKEGDAVATWATHLNYATGSGEHQVVKLSEGTGEINPDGSAQISWDATFSVNYYSTLVPFSIEDPTLTVNADGTGALTGTLIGCAASKTGGPCVPFAPVPDAQIATFAGIEINPLGEVTIDPDYEGVAVETTGAAAQNRTEAGWGAWPQPWVSFQIQTGLSSFFYSSSTTSSPGTDPEKVPYPFTVDFGVETLPIEGASIDWTGNELMQSNLHGFENYFSAGASAGDEGTYKGSESNAEIYLEGSKSIATWVSHESYGPAAGQHQVAHLTGGSGEINADRSAEIEWDAAFSVNFYGGLVPFTIEDPKLTVEPDGTGELTATLVGCEASMSAPGCTPFTPSADVQVATFSGAQVNPNDELTVTPDYSEVSIVEPIGAAPQIRSGAGWGAWPQSFVDFQGETGLTSYWYSSGDEDQKKSPLPFAVDFAGHELEIAHEEVTPPGDGGEEHPDGSTPSTGSGDASTSTPTPASVDKPAKLTTTKATMKLGAGGVVKVATLSCPAGGTTCRTVVPSRVAVKIGGKRYLLTVLAPRQIGAGKSAAIKVRLPKGARRALGDKKLALQIRVGLVANGIATKDVVKVKIAGRH